MENKQIGKFTIWGIILGALAGEAPGLFIGALIGLILDNAQQN